MRRYDTYGFHDGNLERLAKIVEQLLDIRLRPRDSLYRGIYYRGGDHLGEGYILEENGVDAQWHTLYPEYKALLSVNELPDMDTIREKLTLAGGGAVFLRSEISPDLPDEDESEEDDTDEPSSGEAPDDDSLGSEPGESNE